MKKRAHTIYLLNLVIFLSSFTISAVNTFRFNVHTTKADVKHCCLAAKQADQSICAQQQVPEKNESENEGESDVKAFATIIPFLIPFTSSGGESFSYCHDDIAAAGFPEPVYLRICNFRI